MCHHYLTVKRHLKRSALFNKIPFLPASVSLRVCKRSLVCRYTCMYTYVCEGQRSTSGTFISVSQDYILRQGLSLSSELANSARIARQQTPGVLLSLPPWPRDCMCA